MHVNQQTPLDKLEAPIQVVSSRAWVVLLHVCAFVREVMPWA
jgi:hypothetical protein